MREIEGRQRGREREKAERKMDRGREREKTERTIEVKRSRIDH